MILPEADEAAEQVGPPQKGAVFRSGAADDNVVAAASTRRAPVEQEFFSPQARLPSQVIELGGILHKLGPGLGGVNVDFDYARVGGHLECRNAWIERRRIAL